MADGRMLKRAVSTSKKLSKLKTDSARLLYTWMIPFLDIDGRMHAYPAIIKGNVVPLLKTFSHKKIEGYLDDMSANDLIVLYSVEDEIYLQFKVFDKHQNLRRDREKSSKLPPPPGKRPATDGQSPAKDKVSKGKTSQDNEVKAIGEVFNFSSLRHIGQKMEAGLHE